MRFIVLIIFLAVLSEVSAQDTTAVDESRKEAFSLIDEARSAVNSNPEKSAENIQRVLEMNIDLKDDLIEAWSYATLGSLQFRLGNFTKSAQHFERSIRFFEKTDDNKGAYLVYKSLGASYEAGAMYEKAVAAYKRFLDRAANAKNAADRLTTMISLARVEEVRGNLEQSAEWYNKALSLSREMGENKRIIEIHNMLGLLYQDIGDTARAMENFRLSSQLAQSSNDLENLTYTYESLGNYYQRQNDLSKELEIQQQAYEANGRAGNLVAQSDNAYRIASIFIEQKNPEDAIPFLQDAVDLATKAEQPERAVNALITLSKAYELTGDYPRALEIYKRHTSMAEKLAKERKRQEQQARTLSDQLAYTLSEIDILKFEKELTRDSLSAAQQEVQLRDARLEKKEQESQLRQTVIYGLVGILAIVLVSIFLIVRALRDRRRANRQLALQNLRVQMNPHFIFNSLNSINSFIARNDERSANKYLSDFSRLMRAVLENSKHEFVPMKEELEILKIYIGLEHVRFAEKFEFEFKYDPELMSEEILVPPMLIQPYIENAIWHGLRYKEEKGHLRVCFEKRNNHIVAVIEDDGIGRKRSQELKTQNQRQGKSTAMTNIEERLRIINDIHETDLQVDIYDLKDNGKTGTRVEVMMPFIRGGGELES